MNSDTAILTVMVRESARIAELEQALAAAQETVSGQQQTIATLRDALTRQDDDPSRESSAREATA